jgi:hypothetical protein
VTAVSLIRIEFGEIHDFRITCTNCGSEVTIPMERDLPKFMECLGCNKHLWGNGHEAKAAQIVGGIKSYLKAWRELDHKGFSIGFSMPQIDPPSKVQP